MNVIFVVTFAKYLMLAREKNKFSAQIS